MCCCDSHVCPPPPRLGRQVLTSIFEIVGDLFETKNAGWITGASFIAKEWCVT